MYRLLSRIDSKVFLKSLDRYQIPALTSTTSTTSVVSDKHAKRDFINFPDPKRLEKTPEVRLGFIPASYFDALYPITGVSGPYMLIGGALVYIYSKEFLTYPGETALIPSFFIFLYLCRRLFGDTIAKKLDKIIDDEEQRLNNSWYSEKEFLENSITEHQEVIEEAQKIVNFLPDVKRENVYLQMEAAYRRRLQEAFLAVKRKLDYMVEKESIQRSIAQKNLVDWVTRNVITSISEQQKKAALKESIMQLKSILAKA